MTVTSRCLPAADAVGCGAHGRGEVAGGLPKDAGCRRVAGVGRAGHVRGERGGGAGRAAVPADGRGQSVGVAESLDGGAQQDSVRSAPVVGTQCGPQSGGSDPGAASLVTEPGAPAVDAGEGAVGPDADGDTTSADGEHHTGTAAQGARMGGDRVAGDSHLVYGQVVQEMNGEGSCGLRIGGGARGAHADRRRLQGALPFEEREDSGAYGSTCRRHSAAVGETRSPGYFVDVFGRGRSVGPQHGTAAGLAQVAATAAVVRKAFASVGSVASGGRRARGERVTEADRGAASIEGSPSHVNN
ncbi:hypothetical protein SANTM175S_03410 [Streptomyces antimycoticus]